MGKVKMDINYLDRLIYMLKELKKAETRLARLNNFDYEGKSRNQIGKNSADKNYLVMDILRLKHKIHCLSVKLGFVELREPEYYTDSELVEGWRHFHWNRKLEDNL